MALIEELEKSGNWLFKYRSYVPLLLFPFATLVILFGNPGFGFNSTAWYALCLGVSLAGQVVRALVIGFTPAGTSGRNTSQQVAETVNTAGMYSLVRHPLYLGNFLMMCGPFMLLGNLGFFVGASFFYWIYYERIMFAEEGFLRKKFGQSFTDWAAKVPPFFPRKLKWMPNQLSFSLKNILKREYSGILSLGATFAYINFTQHLMYSGKPYISLFWQVVLGTAFVACIVLRTLKKNTSMLEVSGR